MKGPNEKGEYYVGVFEESSKFTQIVPGGTLTN